MKDARPAFLITIDTEGDNLWSRPSAVTTRNAQYLPRFQVLCERFGLPPTYLTNWEMATSRVFQEFARDILRRSAGEIGMHLHAWNSPPQHARTENDLEHQPYLTEYPAEVLYQKVHTLTAYLRDTFHTDIVSHRAGRWAFDEVYARALADCGYEVDCSVTPHYTWQSCRGVPDGCGGPDYRAFPDRPYLLDLRDIRRPGDSGVLELPVSVIPNRDSSVWAAARKLGNRLGFASRVVNRFRPELLWPYPGVQPFRHLLPLARAILAEDRPYFMLVLHSSELMPGGSPRFSSEASVERLYAALEELFEFAASRFQGLTLRDFRELWLGDRSSDSHPSMSIRQELNVTV